VTAEHDLGAIVRARSETFLRNRRTTAAQRKALRAIGACRTPALGGQRQQCDRCGHEHIQWHSCRNRSCPRCGAAARTRWLEARRGELLPVPYFHVVFTIPEALNVFALYAPRVFYDLLFRAAGGALVDVAHSRLQIQPGCLCVLHTWGQTLTLHPHIHCVVPGGGFSQGRQWRSVPKSTFFLPVRVLSRRFRTLLTGFLRQAWREGSLKLPEPVIADALALDLLLARAAATDWVVYCKPPFGGPEQVLGYLANYTHRIAISNSRLVSFEGERVCFRYRDYAHGNVEKLLTLDVDEFLRRFLLHVLPPRLVRIRYYGFLANRTRAHSIELARQLIGGRFLPPVPRLSTDGHRCPQCGVGTLRIVGPVPAERSPPSREDSL
jgi:putative transposase/transposase-like zinc-binding protein